MDFNFSLFEVLLLIGVSQGLLISFLIWTKKYKDKSKLLLSAILITFNLLVCKTLLHSTGLWDNPLFRFFPASIELLIQPLIWFYIHALIYKNYKFNREQFIHFIPFLIFFTYSSFVYISTQYTTLLPLKDQIANELYFSKIKSIEDILSIISSIVYLTLGFKIVRKYQTWLLNHTSNSDFETYKWLKLLVVMFVILVVILIFMLGSEYLLLTNSIKELLSQTFFIYLSFVIYFLGFKGYSLTTLQIEEAQDPDTKSVEIEKSKSNEEHEKIKKLIIQEFDKQKIYLDPELNIQKLADKIKINQNLVSSVINQCFKKSFRTFVNDYRIEEVKKRLGKQDARKYTMAGIAYEAGFNSEASFYRIFRTAEGISPKTYLESVEYLISQSEQLQKI